MAVEVVHELAALACGRYPAFVYRRPHNGMQSGYLPIFTFHTLLASDFEEKLRYLRDNGYRTITLDEALAWMVDGASIPSQAVALTIDDGRLSTWSVGYPLLKRYGMTATAYVIPGYVEEGPCRSTLEDAWRDATTIGAVAADEDEDRTTMLNWPEIEALHRSGVVQIESHTMLHRRVCISEKHVGFLTPDFVPPFYEIPLEAEARSGWTQAALEDRLGMPIHEHAPILSVARGRSPSPAEAEACLSLVRSEGGAAFFAQPGWAKRLSRAARQAVTEAATPDVDFASSQKWEVEVAKRVLEERLPGKVVRHLCYPYGASNARAVRLATEAGYKTSAWGLLIPRRTNRPGANPFHLARLKHDYIYCLPGDGRRNLGSVLGEKISRRLRGNTGF